MYRTENILVLFGDDVYFRDMMVSRWQFDLLDYIIEANPGLNIRFATLGEYFKAVMSKENTYSVYQGDFLPFINRKEQERRSWTGFYSSRPALKKKIFEAHSLLRAAEISAALIQQTEVRGSKANEALHHDAITGTSIPRVSENYLDRLTEDILHSEDIIKTSFSQVLSPTFRLYKITEPYRAFVIYNPVNWIRKELFWISSNSKYVVVYNSAGEAITSQSVPYLESYKIFFEITLRSLSFTTIFLSEKNETCHECSEISIISDHSTVSNDFYTIDFKQGFIYKISIDGVEIELNSVLSQYNSTYGGAYIFKPTVNNK